VSDATQIIAIDGPVGTGKSTVARQVAEILGFAFLDTGAMYRAATWWALHQNVNLDDPAAVAESTHRMRLEMSGAGEKQRVFVNGIEVTEAIRTPELTRQICRLDQNSEVRRHLVALQRRWGEQQPTVAEGRDIGTVVFPKARCKIFLDAAPEVRVARRAKHLAEQGIVVDLDRLRTDIMERDEQTRSRKDSPLRRADDAVLVDTTNLSFDETVSEIVRLAREKL